MNERERQGSASNVVTRCASEHLNQEPAPTGSMLGRYAGAVLVALALAVSVRPILAAFMAVAGMGAR